MVESGVRYYYYFFQEEISAPAWLMTSPSALESSPFSPLAARISASSPRALKGNPEISRPYRPSLWGGLAVVNWLKM